MKIKSFKDCEGREWNINITAGSLLKACRSTGLTLADLTSMNIKVENLIEAIPFFCEKQLNERKMSAEDLLEAITMDEMQTVMNAFFPSVEDAFSSEEDGAVEGKEVDENAPLSHGPASTS